MRKFVIALIILLIALAGLFYLRGLSDEKTVALDQSQPFFDDGELEESAPDKAYLFDGNGEVIGLAKRAYSMGEFIHTVNIDLPAPAESTSYEGWLRQSGENGQTYVRTGKLVNLNNEYFLVFQNKEDLRIYSKVLVTLQKADDGENLGQIVAEGNF